MVKPTAFRRLVLLTLLGLLLLILLPPQGVFAGPASQSTRNRATLCGRLVFLVDYRTQANHIGLIPCSESRPIIFDARPGELYEFYRLTNVVIKKGDRVYTPNYGVLDTYITRFESYKQIYSCRDCDPNAAAAQPQSAEQAGQCAAWVLDQAAAAFPALIEPQQIATLKQNLEAFAGGQVVRQTCGVDSACRIGATAQQLGVQLGPPLRWGGLSAEQAAGWLAELLAEPAALEACPSISAFAPNLLVGLNQQGFGLDLAAIGAGCDLLASDAAGGQAGFEAGSPLEQIDGARVVAASHGQYLLLPAGSTAKLNFACTANDYVNLQLVQRDDSGIRQYTFSRLAVRDGSLGEIDLSASPPVLNLDARGDGAIQERKPDRSLLHPPLVALYLPPTPTSTAARATATAQASPTPQATPTATAPPPTHTPAPTEPPAPTATAESGRIEVCSIAFGVALLPGIIGWRRKHSARRGAISS